MRLDAGTADIVLLAWARLLGFADDAFASSGDRLTKINNDAGALTFVRLFDRSALVGPEWAVEAAAPYSDDELTEYQTLMQVSREHGGHGLGKAVLSYADDMPVVQPEREATVSTAGSDVARLESMCPPDDNHEVGLAGMDKAFVLLDGSTPMAGAGYKEWQQILANLSVLTAPAYRRHDTGELIAAIARHEEL
ncbi:GNAT family N-acetyltransferase, partial [Arthrobacter sulfonylureivorans]|uniref:GNAT family N-acetyltransferase n=1 Tax=Arthrobacter sulfonylureivorans TaxID=2486855 RepID=UPI0039E65BEF